MKFKKLTMLVTAGALSAALLIPTIVSAHPKGIDTSTLVDGAVLSGQHYNLNIIGVKNPKKANMDDTSGHVIFVDLSGKSKINLVEGDDFAVLDKNGTDADGATLQLPDPGLDPYVVGDEGDADTITNYSIFVRPLGQPGNSAKITTCADVLDGPLAAFLGADEVNVLNEAADLGGVCSIESTGQLCREKGQSIFTNQTAAMLTMVLKLEVTTIDDVTGGETIETLYVRVPIFNEMLENEYWEYDNSGLKLLQVRIYRVGTDVTNYDNPELWDTLPLNS